MSTPIKNLSSTTRGLQFMRKKQEKDAVIQEETQKKNQIESEHWVNPAFDTAQNAPQIIIDNESLYSYYVPQTNNTKNTNTQPTGRKKYGKHEEPVEQPSSSEEEEEPQKKRGSHSSDGSRKRKNNGKNVPTNKRFKIR